MKHIYKPTLQDRGKIVKACFLGICHQAVLIGIDYSSPFPFLVLISPKEKRRLAPIRIYDKEKNKMGKELARAKFSQYQAICNPIPNCNIVDEVYFYDNQPTFEQKDKALREWYMTDPELFI